MPIRLTIYSKSGCHLCEHMAALARHVGRSVPIDIEEIDITSDADLLARYETAIPVLLIEGREVARYRIRERDLTADAGAPVEQRCGLSANALSPTPQLVGYFAVMMKWPRRFWDQHASVSSLQKGCSLPLLTVLIRLAAMPRLTR